MNIMNLYERKIYSVIKVNFGIELWHGIQVWKLGMEYRLGTLAQNLGMKFGNRI